MNPSPANLASEYDLVVIGTGAAGMTAALVGACSGLRVALIEKSAQIGGTSARAAGTLWIPGNRFMTADDATEDIQAARVYLDHLIGERSPGEMREAFFELGPAMLEFLQQHTAVRFKACPRHADYHPELPGARSGGRPVEPEIFDGRQLGQTFDLLRPTIAEFMVFGGMMVSKADIDLLLQARKTRAGFRHAIQLGARYLRDRIRFSRGTRLTMGNALCASLLQECLLKGVALTLNTDIQSVRSVGDHGHQLRLAYAGTISTITATHGIVFAGGGFSGNREARAEHLPEPTPQVTAAYEGANGSSQALAMSLGAQLGASREDNAWWFPSSRVLRADGSEGVFPHIIMDRAKPGLIAVDRRGRRFTNEGASYHQFARAQYASGAVPCWLICDATFLRCYGLGVIRPGGAGLRAALANGCVSRAKTLIELAAAIDIDPVGLLDSAQRMNRYADTGVDEDFGKGGDALSRQNGDGMNNMPNPCLGPISTAPFYAVEVSPADLGTSRGLLTDTHARLLDANGQAIAGLYACGNDMQSMMGGQYPAPGVTLGPGMAFAYAAARHCASRRKD